jgi:tetratricopeptide (TPR) repeat protein
MSKTLSRIICVVIGLAALGALAVGVYRLPVVQEKLGWRVDNLVSQVQYLLHPPEKVVFVPNQTVDQIVAATMGALTPMAKPSPTAQSTALESATTAPTQAPTAVPTPIPGSVTLTGIIHEYQTWNNCGPATLAMDLSFWGWKGDQRDTAAFTKPNARDKNVMPYELQDFVTQKTQLKAIIRLGGDLDTLKRLVAAGFPVIVEKGFEVEGEGWMGHYEVVNGYDDAKNRFITQDSYSQAENTDYLAVSYDQMQKNWRAFDYIYLVVYPPERENDVFSVLGAQADESANYQYAAQKAADEIPTLSGRDQYFAWFNRGTSLVDQADNAGAAQAFDQAFTIYPTIDEKHRPWRMIWYQTGPYFAYYYTGRYQDVINLATSTLSTMSEQTIEETWVWRARARAATGDTQGAIDDLKQAIVIHPGFQPALDELANLGG